MKLLANTAPILAAALAIAACGQGGPVAENAQNVTELPSVDTVAGGRDGVPSADGAAPANVATTAPAPTPKTPAAAIPAVLHGHWGMTPGDCDVSTGAAKGHLAINSEGLRFFESRAIPVANVKTSDHSISGDFAFTGEGQAWTKFQALTLDDDRLVRTESSPMASFIYARCR